MVALSSYFSLSLVKCKMSENVCVLDTVYEFNEFEPRI